MNLSPDTGEIGGEIFQCTVRVTSLSADDDLFLAALLGELESHLAPNPSIGFAGLRALRRLVANIKEGYRNLWKGSVTVAPVRSVPMYPGPYDKTMIALASMALLFSGVGGKPERYMAWLDRCGGSVIETGRARRPATGSGRKSRRGAGHWRSGPGRATGRHRCREPGTERTHESRSAPAAPWFAPAVACSGSFRRSGIPS